VDLDREVLEGEKRWKSKAISTLLGFEPMPFQTTLNCHLRPTQPPWFCCYILPKQIQVLVSTVHPQPNLTSIWFPHLHMVSARHAATVPPLRLHRELSRLHHVSPTRHVSMSLSATLPASSNLHKPLQIASIQCQSTCTAAVITSRRRRHQPRSSTTTLPSSLHAAAAVDGSMAPRSPKAPRMRY